MTDVSKTIAIIFEAQNKASAALADIEKGLASLETEAGQAGTEVAQTGKEIDELGTKGASIDRVTQAMTALAASLVVKAFIDANVAAETFERTMTLLKGSSEAAAQEFDYVSGFAQKLGLDLFTTADAYAQLSAATRGTALEGQATRDIFEAVATAMAALGKSSEQTEGALLAVQQMVSKGTVSMEELRQQLGERLPVALSAAAAGLGVSTKELDKLVSSGKVTAEELLPKMAAELNKTFGGATFDGYAASMNRLRTEISLAFIEIGDAGAFDLMIAGVNAATATLTGAISVVKLMGETLGNLAFTIASGDFSGFGDRFDASLQKAAGSTKSLIDALAGTKDETTKVAVSGEAAGAAIASSMTEASTRTTDLTKASAELDKLLKTLGIDPKIFKDPIDEINKAFTDLAANPALDGEKFLAGLVGALRNLPQDANLDELRQQVAYAFRDGKISVDELNQSLALLDVKQQGLSPSFAPVTAAATKQAEELAKTAAAAKKAEENARDYALEMEKIASNERIKFIEANVQLNVAQLEADTERIKSAFASIDNTITSTTDLIGDLFGLFGNNDLTFSQLNLIKDQIEFQNAIQKDAAELQKLLTQAQIDNLRAQTSNLLKGDALIKVDGAGLQPHLEAFMWEILKTIQVRVNQQGLSMLLGV